MAKRYWEVGIHSKALTFQQVREVAGGRDTRFLVLQYEGGALTGYRAAMTNGVTFISDLES
jgi:hypothetical protein